MHIKCLDICSLLVWLFLCSLIFCLCLSHISVTNWQAEFGEVILIQVRNLGSRGEQAIAAGQIKDKVGDQAYYNHLGSHLKAMSLNLPLNSFAQIASDAPNKVHKTIDLANFVQSPTFESLSSLVTCPQSLESAENLASIQQTLTLARRLRDSRTLSFALGILGHFYECRQDYQQAIKLTKQAQMVAEENLNAQDSLFLWYWQFGRILKAQNKISQAIKAYERAYNIFKNIYNKALIANKTFQFDLKNSFELMHRQFIELKLSLENTKITGVKPNNHIDNLSYVLALINELQLIEMQNYCIKDCALPEINSQQLDVYLEASTAIFHSIILEKQTAIIVSLPNGEKKLRWINVDDKTLKAEVNKFRIDLENYGDIIYNPSQAQKLYDWIIRPFANDLESLEIETLVFIPDGILRSIPMAALHDGKKFLVENYAIANTPSLSVINSPAINFKNTKALAVGLTKDIVVDGQKYQALSNVAAEIRQVEEQIPGSKQLLNENFTRDRLQAELGKSVYPIIHIATHGEFGDHSEDTFLVTGDHDKLTITELNRMIRTLPYGARTIDLLTLTACETAVGDDSATLGLAGVAVQAGIRSALASLWSINDGSTVKLVTEFYQAWHQRGMSKAEALRTAQQALISTDTSAHPAYWAAFILVGNWL